jgi:cell division protein FtsL
MAALHRPAIPAPRVFRAPRSKRTALYLIGAIVVGVALLQVNQFSRLTSTGYEIESLKRDRDMQLAENHKLEADVASLSSLARVDWVARTELGMEPPARRLYIDVNHAVPGRQTLPTRFLPEEQPAGSAEEQRSAPLWKRAVGWLLPF